LQLDSIILANIQISLGASYHQQGDSSKVALVAFRCVITLTIKKISTKSNTSFIHLITLDLELGLLSRSQFP